MSNFVENELRQRQSGDVDKYLNEYKFLSEINNNLLEIEESLYAEKLDELPNCWIIGLPRSGTTLLSQLLCNCLEVGYINNFIARFWRVPVTGIKFSKIILGDDRGSSFKSDYGKSDTIYGPHEFSYFWQWLLKMENMPPYLPDEATAKIDWHLVKKIFINISNAFGKCVVYKALDVGYHIEKFHALFPKSLFIYIERDPMDVASSLVNARINYYQDVNKWWSMYPVEYNKIVDIPYWQQIPAQMFFLKKMYEYGFGRVNPKNVLKITYDELCLTPSLILNKVITFIENLSSYKTKQINDPPPEFKKSKPNIIDDYRKKLLLGLKEYNFL